MPQAQPELKKVSGNISSRVIYLSTTTDQIARRSIWRSGSSAN
jgi:hypothetical protein